MKHNLLSTKLKQLHVSPHLVNWYHSFLSARQQRILSGHYHRRWKAVNKGTTQGSVSGPHLFNIFLNDLEITYDGFPALFKYADDSTIVAPVLGNTDTSVALVNELLNWSRDNRMSCNPSKCKELVIRKKSNKDTYNLVNCIPQHSELCLLGVTLQSDCKFSSHVKVKLAKANKGLHILRTLRKEQYDQNEIHLLFKTIVLSNLTYCLSVYGAHERDLNTVQNFLSRCYKRRYISVPLNVKDIMYTQDKKLFGKARALTYHPLNKILPKPKPQQYNLRRMVCLRPKINTERFKNTFVNRLIFEHNLL